MKIKRYAKEGANEYRDANKRIQKTRQQSYTGYVLSARRLNLPAQNNSKTAYHLVKDLPSEKQGRSSTIRDSSGNCLTEEQDILSKWTDYCLELYTHEISGGDAKLDCSQPPEDL